MTSSQEEKIARLNERIKELEKENNKLASKYRASRDRTAKIAWLLSNIVAVAESRWGGYKMADGGAALSLRKHLKGIRLGVDLLTK